MKWLNCRKIRLILIVFMVAIMLSVGTAKADFTCFEPVNLGPIINGVNLEWSASLSADGLSLYFASAWSPSGSDFDIFMATRETLDSDWSEPVNPGPNINDPELNEASPCISYDGLELYFHRSGIYVATRETTDDEWGLAVNLGDTVNNGRCVNPCISGDGLSLYFNSSVAGGEGSQDIYVTTRSSKNDPWGTPVNLGPTVNSSSIDSMPSITPDGLSLIFSSNRPGGYTGWNGDIYVTTRRSTSDPWGEPINLGPIINTDNVDGADVSPLDGTTLFLSYPAVHGGYGSYDIWQTQIIPIVDFNGDGFVDLIDLILLTDNWGTDDSLYDIGPMPWGDGIVDAYDVLVLAEYMIQDIADLDDVNDL